MVLKNRALMLLCINRKFGYKTFPEKYHLLCSQNHPVNGYGQTHWKEVPCSSHKPPLLHLSGKHFFNSRIKKKNSLNDVTPQTVIYIHCISKASFSSIILRSMHILYTY